MPRLLHSAALGMLLCIASCIAAAHNLVPCSLHRAALGHTPVLCSPHRRPRASQFAMPIESVPYTSPTRHSACWPSGLRGQLVLPLLPCGGVKLLGVLMLIASRVTPAVLAWSTRAAAIASSLDGRVELGRARADRISHGASLLGLVNSWCRSRLNA